MVVRHRKKLRRQRGYKWHGYGAKKKHRGKGSHGGRGYAGSHKHKWSYINKYEPDHFGKKGFFSLNKKGKEINIDQLMKLAENTKEIDLGKHGFTKLLGRGKVSHSVNVKVDYCSTRAKEKITAAGGSVQTLEGE
ncbi:MAG: uL15 family ribosomal protein [Candidatus Aenigmarchaeota archaeon]|nr:uL15 family ribosomal protein [Candidatus Aenigmarchaeota archaeon]